MSPCRLISLIALALAVPAWATDARAVGDRVWINEVEVAQVKTRLGQAAPAQRAASAAQTLLAWKPGTAVEAKAAGKDWKVVFGTRTVLTVTTAEAKAWNVAADVLARAWADRIATALALPPLEVEATSVRMPVSGTRELRLVGSEARKAAVAVNGKGVAVARTPGRLVLSSTAAGRATLTLKGWTAKQAVTVDVLPLAGRLPTQLTVEVTGAPATAEAVRAALEAALLGATDSPNDARIERCEGDVPSVGNRASSAMTLKATIAAAGHWPVTVPVRAVVRNTGRALGPEAVLWYSNHPESLERTGPLYWGRLEVERPVRLLYHHQNQTPQPMVVQYVLVNRAPTPARVMVTLGEAPPDGNPTRAGYVAGENFLARWRVGGSQVLTVRPGQAVPLVLKRIANLETVSGLARLEALDGPVDLHADALWATRLLEGWRPTAGEAEPWRRLRPVPAAELGLPEGGEPKHVYLAPFRDERFAYEVGGRFAFVRIGEKSIPSEGDGSGLSGNFGVIYRVDGVLTNPGTAPAEADVVFEASAGYSGALFLMDGQIVRAGLLQPKQEFLLKTVKVPPGQTVHVRFLTLPLSGASYPATVTVRPAGIELGLPEPFRSAGRWNL
jgi:hypothetical protein